jgi:hypothetical protein
MVEKIEVHPYLTEDETPKWVKNTASLLKGITKGTAPRREQQGKTIQLTVEDILKWDERREKIKDEFAEWLVKEAERSYAKATESPEAPFKGREIVMRTLGKTIESTFDAELTRTEILIKKIPLRYQPPVLSQAIKRAKRTVDIEDKTEDLIETVPVAFGYEAERVKPPSLSVSAVLRTLEFVRDNPDLSKDEADMGLRDMLVRERLATSLQDAGYLLTELSVRGFVDYGYGVRTRILKRGREVL